MSDFKIISLRENPEKLELFFKVFTSHWGNEAVYRDCLAACIGTVAPLPQWYILQTAAGETAGCAGLITNDFVSRMDLWPYLCALYVEEWFRGHEFGKVLIDHVRGEAAKLGYESIYLCTDHVGYYEKYGFEYIGDGFHPWGESSRLYHSHCKCTASQPLKRR